MRDKLIVIGAGGHARSVIDIALQNDEYEVVGCIDKNNGSVFDIPVIGDDNVLPKLFSEGIKYIFVAIGDNRLRNMLFETAISIGFKAVNIISRYAVISPRAKLGTGICIMSGAVINTGTFICDNCIINSNCSIDHDCLISASSHIAPGVTLSGNVKVGEGVHIGTGSSVIDNIAIGNWSYIGAGAVVVNIISPNTLAYGVPAKEVKNF